MSRRFPPTEVIQPTKCPDGVVGCTWAHRRKWTPSHPLHKKVLARQEPKKRFEKFYSKSPRGY